MNTSDEIDLRGLLLVLWGKRLVILLATLLGMSGALAYAFLAPRIFESSVLLIPTSPPGNDQLGAAAALLGKKGGNLGDLDLYQTLLTSRTVLQKVLRSPIRNLSDTGRGRSAPVSWFYHADTANPMEFSLAMQALARSIEVTMQGSGQGGILQVTVSARQPWLAQQIADRLVQIGQEEIRQVRVERSNAILARLTEASSSARAEWDRSAAALAGYQERNRSILLPGQMLTIERLMIERQVKEQKYLLVRREYEQQQLERIKATPPALILDPADLPARKSKPRGSIILALGTMVSFVIACCAVLAWSAFARPASSDGRDAAAAGPAGTSRKVLTAS